MLGTFRVPIRFSDIDAFGHMGHSDVIALCQEHRNAMFEDLAKTTGVDLVLAQGFVLASVHAVFRRAIHLDDRRVDIECAVSRLGTTSLTLEYRLRVGSEAAAEVTAVLVFVEDGVPRALSPAERTWFSTGIPDAA